MHYIIDRGIKYIVLVFSVLLLSSCGKNRLAGEKETLTIDYDGMNFQVSKIKRLGQINSYGGGSFTGVKKGKFFVVTLEAKNNSDVKKQINLRQIILCDSSKRCLRVGRIDYNTVVDMPSDSILKLKPNQKDGRHMFYAGPRDFDPMYMVISNEKNVYIKFKFIKD